MEREDLPYSDVTTNPLSITFQPRSVEGKRESEAARINVDRDTNPLWSISILSPPENQGVLFLPLLRPSLSHMNPDSLMTSKSDWRDSSVQRYIDRREMRSDQSTLLQERRRDGSHRWQPWKVAIVNPLSLFDCLSVRALSPRRARHSQAVRFVIQFPLGIIRP